MNRESSKSALFLMELILAILFFALASAVCVQLFARAHTVSADTRDASRAVVLAQDAAAALQSTNGSPEAAAELLGGSAENGALTVYYDAGWAVCGKQAAVYRLTAVPDPAAERAGITLVRLRDIRELCSLSVRWHTPITVLP